MPQNNESKKSLQNPNSHPNLRHRLPQQNKWSRTRDGRRVSEQATILRDSTQQNCKNKKRNLNNKSKESTFSFE